MAGVLSVVHDLRTFWDRWHECHAIAGKGSSGDDALRIFLDNHLAGDRLPVTAFGRSPVAITAARHNAGKAGVRALVPDAPEAA
jgi:hypothetical protein